MGKFVCFTFRIEILICSIWYHACNKFRSGKNGNVSHFIFVSRWDLWELHLLCLCHSLAVSLLRKVSRFTCGENISSYWSQWPQPSWPCGQNLTIPTLKVHIEMLTNKQKQTERKHFPTKKPNVFNSQRLMLVYSQIAVHKLVWNKSNHSQTQVHLFHILCTFPFSELAVFVRQILFSFGLTAAFAKNGAKQNTQ